MAQILNNPARSLMLLLTMLVSVLVCTGCSNPQPLVDGKLPVEISGKTFQLEIVADNETRTKGLGDRRELAPGEGMLFSFPDSRIRTFVMRDCYIDIDIIFLDSAGNIVAMHQMKVEEPKRPDETQSQYENRLKKYPSRFNAQYAIELAGGALDQLDLTEGDHIDLNTSYLESVTQ